MMFRSSFWVIALTGWLLVTAPFLVPLHAKALIRSAIDTPRNNGLPSSASAQSISSIVSLPLSLMALQQGIENHEAQLDASKRKEAPRSDDDDDGNIWVWCFWKTTKAFATTFLLVFFSTLLHYAHYRIWKAVSGRGTKLLTRPV